MLCAKRLLASPARTACSCTASTSRSGTRTRSAANSGSSDRTCECCCTGPFSAARPPWPNHPRHRRPRLEKWAGDGETDAVRNALHNEASMMEHQDVVDKQFLERYLLDELGPSERDDFEA